MITGVRKLVVDVEDLDRAKAFWTTQAGFRLEQDTPYGEGSRWLEVTTPDGGTTLVLSCRKAGQAARAVPEALPTSNIFFVCDDLQQTYSELAGRGVVFPQPPVQLGFGWWSMFTDTEGNRFALVPAGQ